MKKELYYETIFCNAYCFKFNNDKNNQIISITGGIDDSISFKVLAPNGMRVLVYNFSYTPRLALNAYSINPSGQA